MTAGATRIVAVVKEDIATEVADFRKGYWSGEVFLDPEKKFFTALGGGVQNQPYTGASFLAAYANPFSKARMKKSLDRATTKGFEGNLVGEGLVTGGVYVIRQDGKAAYSFLEEDVGDHAPLDDVIEGIKAAVRREKFVLAPQSAEEREAGSRRQTWKEWAGRETGPDGYAYGDITKGLARNKMCSIM